MLARLMANFLTKQAQTCSCHENLSFREQHILKIKVAHQLDNDASFNVMCLWEAEYFKRVKTF